MTKPIKFNPYKRQNQVVNEKSDVSVPFNYRARKHQVGFWTATAAGIKRVVLVWHRRAGKDKTCWNYLIKEAFKRVGTYYYIFPDSKMARRILWDGIDGSGFRVIEHVPANLQKSINNTEMKIYLVNGSIIHVLGSHDVDSLRGPNPVGCVFSEYAEQSPSAWQVVSPILRENKGWAIFNFTPKGQNHARDLFEMARVNPLWYAELLTVNDTFREDGTPVITTEDIEAEKREGMSEDMVMQEYFCSFTLGVEGAYYAKYVETAKTNGRVGNVPYDKQSQVHTAWDIGYGDSTAITFFQLVGQEIHVIDYYESHGEGLPHYAKVLADKSYVYGYHYAPHDIDSHAFSSGLSGREVGASIGIRFFTLPTLKLRLEDGIEAVRGIFPRLWIDGSKCKQLIKCLENYRKAYDEKHNCYKNTPVHNWASHGADSFRYMAIAIRRHVDEEKTPGVTIDDAKAEGWANKFYPRFD